MEEKEIKDLEQFGEIDPDPMTIMLEIANLVIQPGSLALIASATTATTAVLNRVDANNKRKSEIRSRLYTIDRALTTGFAALMKLGSMLDQFQFLDQERRLGGAPIRGFKNAKDLRDTHNECRDAVKEARDAFMDLSEFLPNIHAETVDTAIRRLDFLSKKILVGGTYGTFLVAAALAIQEVDRLICEVGRHYDYSNKTPRDFLTTLMQSFPNLPRERDMDFY